MKTAPFIMFAIPILLNSCKGLKGSYCTPPNYTAACIEFKGKQELLLHTITDHGTGSMDYGKYRIHKDSLIVHYLEMPEKYKLKSEEHYTINSYRESDSVELKITCKGVPFLEIYCTPIDSDSIFFGKSSKTNEALTVKLPKSKTPFKLHAHYLKSSVAVPINKNGSYDISITLNSLTGQTSYNTRKHSSAKFLIKEKNHEKYLEQIGNETGGKFYKYKRKTME